MLAQNITSTPTKKNGQLARNAKFINTILRAIYEKKGEHIICMDMRNLQESVADFFIVCEAASTIQLKAISDNIEKETIKKCNDAPYRRELGSTYRWILLDYVNVVVHIMHPEIRSFYELEELWSDAPITKYDAIDFK